MFSNSAYLSRVVCSVTGIKFIPIDIKGAELISRIEKYIRNGKQQDFKLKLSINLKKNVLILVQIEEPDVDLYYFSIVQFSQ